MTALVDMSLALFGNRSESLNSGKHAKSRSPVVSLALLSCGFSGRFSTGWRSLLSRSDFWSPWACSSSRATSPRSATELCQLGRSEARCGSAVHLSRATPDESGEHHDPLGRAVERVAGAQDEAVVAHGVQDPGGVVVDDLGLLNPVGEGAVGHGEDDPVAALEVVDMAEGRPVGGTVAGDGHGAALAGQRCGGVVPRALAKRDRVGALDHED